MTLKKSSNWFKTSQSRKSLFSKNNIYSIFQPLYTKVYPIIYVMDFVILVNITTMKRNSFAFPKAKTKHYNF